jgi:23S rRNA pseudouridine2605 synthase
MIERGLVQVNGKTVSEFGTRVQPDDTVVVNGRQLTALEHVYLLMNKPADCITTTADERGRKTVMDLIGLPPERRKGLFPVGRLDRKTTGVLLLTNDGELGHRLAHPSFEVSKDYRVLVSGEVTEAALEMLRRGVSLEDGPARADRVMIVESTPGKSLIGLRIHEGRNRIVRRMMEALGLPVKKLHRQAYAGLTTRGVRSGHWRHLSPREVGQLRRLVRLKTNSRVER